MPSQQPSPRNRLIPLAFASVYLLWGSTYLAIHVAGETLPVPVVGATRSLLSSGIVAIIYLARGRSLRVPPGEGWRLALVGVLFMTCNNMLLIWGETMVPSGFASLIVSTMPIMIALIEVAIVFSGRPGEPLNRRGWAGTLLGLAGIAVLVSPTLRAEFDHQGLAGYSHPLKGLFALLGAALSFAVGSVLSRRFQFKADTLIATGWQIGAAGIVNLALALLTGGFHRAVWTWHGIAAIGYLSIFGSLFGLVAFTYLLKNVAVTKVSTYAFVNPPIAVLLGFLFLGERLVLLQVGGMAIIVCGVALVVLSRIDFGKREIAGAAGNTVD
jgi:drug/metabolite transporter (DMT)-like permease